MKEKIFKAINGWLVLFLVFAWLAAGFIFQNPILWVILGVTASIITLGFTIISPNNAVVMTLFGKYVGSIKEDGFFWTNPFFFKKRLTLRANNFDSERLKVNDKRGNPIQISVILVWRVRDTFKAAFEVTDFMSFVRVQTDAAVRKLAGIYPYDHIDDNDEITLRSGHQEINEQLEKELQERLNIAGIEVLEARIGYLAYAPEIAAVMLKRQQAEAIVAARYKIVEGALGMVDGALTQLDNKKLASWNDKEKVNLISNLMVVLCSDKEAVPTIEMSANER